MRKLIVLALFLLIACTPAVVDIFFGVPDALPEGWHATIHPNISTNKNKDIGVWTNTTTCVEVGMICGSDPVQPCKDIDVTLQPALQIYLVDNLDQAGIERMKQKENHDLFMTTTNYTIFLLHKQCKEETVKLLPYLRKHFEKFQ
jgi:hypothetical protein